MTGYKLELKDLDANDRFNALVALLVSKGIMTNEECDGALVAILELKNAQFAKELEENSWAKLFLDLSIPKQKGPRDEG